MGKEACPEPKKKITHYTDTFPDYFYGGESDEI